MDKDRLVVGAEYDPVLGVRFAKAIGLKLQFAEAEADLRDRYEGLEEFI